MDIMDILGVGLRSLFDKIENDKRYKWVQNRRRRTRRWAARKIITAYKKKEKQYEKDRKYISKLLKRKI